MRHKQFPKWFSYFLVLCIGYIPLTACSKEPPRSSKDRFSYTLTLDEKGLPVVNGIQGKRVAGPVDAKKIVRVRTMSIMDVEGSHYILIELGGTMYQINLPD